MIAASQEGAKTLQVQAGSELPLPSWIDWLLGAEGRCTQQAESGVELHVRAGGKWTLVTARVRDAISLAGLDFQRETARAYAAIGDVLRQSACRYPVRFWNFLPDIGGCPHSGLAGTAVPHRRQNGTCKRCPPAEGRTDADLNRYMVFNAGRFSAYLDWYGETASFEQTVATATGIGHASEDLVIHVLAGRMRGRHVENPRQRQASCYSPRHGPLPPCFARATVAYGETGMEPLILVGGTASVRGEDSVHHDDVGAQVEETLDNIEAVLEAAWRRLEAPPATAISADDIHRSGSSEGGDERAAHCVGAAAARTPHGPGAVRSEPEVAASPQGTHCVGAATPGDLPETTSHDCPSKPAVRAVSSSPTLLKSQGGDHSVGRRGHRLLRHVRVYCVPGVAIDAVRARVGAWLAETCELEFLRATICRPELLVEIEGVATPSARGWEGARRDAS